MLVRPYATRIDMTHGNEEEEEDDDEAEEKEKS